MGGKKLKCCCNAVYVSCSASIISTFLCVAPHFCHTYKNIYEICAPEMSKPCLCFFSPLVLRQNRQTTRETRDQKHTTLIYTPWSIMFRHEDKAWNPHTNTNSILRPPKTHYHMSLELSPCMHFLISLMCVSHWAWNCLRPSNKRDTRP